MISKDFAGGLFIGGIIALMIMGLMGIWELWGLAPLVWILILDLIFFIDMFIDKLKQKGSDEK